MLVDQWTRPYTWAGDPLTSPGEVYYLGTGLYLDTLDRDGDDAYADLADVQVGDLVRVIHDTGTLQLTVTEVDPLTPPPPVDDSGTVILVGDVQASPTYSPAVGDPVAVRLVRNITPPPDPTTGGNMTTEVFKIAKGEVGFALADPGVAVDAATIANYTAFSCRVTRGLVTASSNFDTAEVPGTMCDPAAETITPSAPTFTLELDVLQDPQDDQTTGLAKFLWDNDSGVTGSPVWFYLGLAEGADPKIIGQCYVSPMDFGGNPREVLTATLQFPVEGRPSPSWGTTPDA